MSPGNQSASETGSQSRLDSWKEIAGYLGRSVRCVQQWEAEYGLPVHRLNYDKKASVYAYKEALDAWRIERGKNLEVEPTPAVAVPEEVARSSGDPAPRRKYIGTPMFLGVLICLIAGAIVFIKSMSGHLGEKRVRVRPLGIAAGTEMMPAFSPDGTRVAYVWDGGQDEEAQAIEMSIYIKQVDADKTVRLTQSVWDVFPQWSPDGQLISFYRPPEVMVIPAIGGREAKLGEIKFGGIGHVQTWSGDSRGVIAADRDLGAAGSLWFLPLDMSGRSRVTEPPAGSGDLTPAMSPDGKMLAFTRNNASLANNIFLLPMDGHRPAGPEQQLTFEKSTTYFYLTWAEDGKSLFCLRSRPDPAVIRVSINKNEPIEVVPQILPSVTNFLAAAPRGNRLAWSTAIYDRDLWRTELSVAGTEQRRRHTRVAHTMRPEQEAALSPDGSMLAFMSGRGGTNQLWLSDADGNNAIVFDPRKSHHPSWSPDGKQIAYELFDRGGIDIYVKPVRYGAGRRVTEEPSLGMRPAWSRNGRWIYFSSNRAGLRDIWKVPAEGGAMVRVTQKGGLRAAESMDGQTIYFTKEDSDWGVWAMPVKGGSGTKIIGGLLSPDGFHVSTEGIYAVMKNGPKGGTSLVRYSFRSRQIEPVETLDGRFHQSISMSADARWLVYDALRYRSGDLMMIEGLQ